MGIIVVVSPLWLDDFWEDMRLGLETRIKSTGSR